MGDSGQVVNGAPPLSRGTSRWRRGLAVVRALQVRLRFLAVFLVLFLLVGQWDTLRTYFDKLTRPGRPGGETVSHNVEYWCPMCPGVLADWPGKCPVCNMALVQRKRGEAVPLPDGVLARMQLSPYRVQLAGIQVSPVSYRPLAREVLTAGFVEHDERRVQRVAGPIDGTVRQVSAAVPGAVVEQGEVLLTLSRPGPVASPENAVVELVRKYKELGLRREDVELPAADGSEGLRLTLRAPGPRHVVSVHARAGQKVAAGDVLLELADLSRVCVRAEVSDGDLPFLRAGQKAELVAEASPGHAAWKGNVRRLTARLTGGVRSLQVVLDVDNPGRALRPGLFVTARLAMPVAETEPFRSLPTGRPVPRAGELRQLYLCPDHPDLPHEQPGKCPLDRNDLEPRPLAANQQLGWWCPVHPHVTSDSNCCTCPECGGMKLLPRIVTYQPPGEVLSVPESAVIDTGAKRMVYVERMPGMFDGIEVVLGPRCGEFFPVVRGLEAGERVAATGAFLIDAETRLNPTVAAGYFGAAQGGGRPLRQPAPPQPAGGPSAVQGLLLLPPEDRAQAAAQGTCPVTGQPLGSMGKPPRVVVEGRTVFLCCEGCEAALRKKPGQYLSRLRGK